MLLQMLIPDGSEVSSPRVKARGGEESDSRWEELPLSELVSRLEERHILLRTALPELEKLVRKVLAIHGALDPHTLTGLARTFFDLRGRLEQLLELEQTVLFPSVRHGRWALVPSPVQTLRAELAEVRRLLEELHELASRCTVPANTCSSWKALRSELEAFDGSVTAHLDLENEVLLPRLEEASAQAGGN